MSDPVSPARWQRIKLVFQAALDLPPSQRARYVETASQGDEDLRAEVESLLQANEDSGDFLSGVAAAYVPEAVAPDGPDANVGRRIGAYQIVRAIGEGGMGAVYLAERCDEFRQQVAIKLLRPGLDSRAVVSRFRHERQILAGLDHPNIARLFDGGATEDGRPYFVMEYIQGDPIDKYARTRNLDIAERLRLFRQVCAAVQYAHQNLIVHRDIKPGNILVTNGGVPKLMDFGIAKLLGGRDTRETLLVTQAGTRLMTPAYASPEQARGLPITTAADIYPLGAVLYELLTGKLPYAFPDDAPSTIERIICETEPRPPSAVAAAANARKLAGDLDTIVLKALQKEPGRRYSSVEQLSADIERHQQGVPIQARPQTFAYRAGRFVRRNRLAVGAAALLFLSLAAGLATTAWQARIARDQRLRAERRFNDVRQLAHAFLFDFHDAIQNLPGATPARRLVVQKALQYLSRLSKEAGRDLSLEHEVAEAYLRVGDVQGNPFGSNLGDSAGALDSYQRALAIAQDAVQRDPRDLASERYLARAQRSIGDILESRADPAAAVSHHHEAIRILEAARASDPGDWDTRFELATTYQALGDVLGHPGYPNTGDTQGAWSAYEKAQSLDESLAKDQPDNPRPRSGIATLRMKLADIELDAGNTADALRDYQDAAARFGELSAADPLNARTLLMFAVAVGKLGSAYMSAGQTRQALDQYQKSTDIHRRLVEADPQNAQSKNSYALSLKERAELLHKTGDSAGAAGLYREALDIMRQLSAADPGSTIRRGRVAEFLAALGWIAAEQGRKQEAAQLYRENLKILKEIADGPGASADDVWSYAEQLLTCPVPELANPAQAVVSARRAVDMTQQKAPDNLEQLARAYHAAGDSANAVAWEERALGLIPASSPDRKKAEERLALFRSHR